MNNKELLDKEENRYIAYLSYLSLLCFLPPILRPNSKFCKFHSKQGLALLIYQICIIALSYISNILSSFGVHMAVTISIDYVVAISWIMYFTFIVFGVLNITKGFEKKLPIIGRLFKEET